MRPVGRSWAEVRKLFPAADRSIYLDHAAVGPTSTLVADAVAQSIAAQTATGLPASVHAREKIATVRRRVAEFVGGNTHGVAFVQNTSFGLSLVANGIAWAAGDGVVLPRDEFPSNYFAWQRLRTLGADVRLVNRASDGSALASIREATDRHTRVVAISAVQFSDGFRQDLAGIAQVCADNDALLVVDGTQSVGALRADVTLDGVDVLVVGAHKWMLSPMGTGFAHFSDRALERIHPSTVGWMSVDEPFAFDYRENWDRSARRFEPGTENAIGISGMGAAIDIFMDAGVHEVESRIHDLISGAIELADTLGVEVISPRDGARRSGILILRNRGEDAHITYRRLIADGFLCSARGGGVRLSPHCYTAASEVSAAVQTVANRP